MHHCPSSINTSNQHAANNTRTIVFASAIQSFRFCTTCIVMEIMNWKRRLASIKIQVCRLLSGACFWFNSFYVGVFQLMFGRKGVGQMQAEVKEGAV